jgi:hypothetical protein
MPLPAQLGVDVYLVGLRARLQKIKGAELLAFRKQMGSLVYPLIYGWNGKPNVTAIELG